MATVKTKPLHKKRTEQVARTELRGEARNSNSIKISGSQFDKINNYLNSVLVVHN